jgi:hypothetical protein
VAVWIEFQSRDYLNGLEELLSLRHRKAEYQPSGGGQKSILVAGFQARSGQEIFADHVNWKEFHKPLIGGAQCL